MESDNNEIIIYIKLLNEGIDVIRPVKALVIDPNNYIFKILDKEPETETWEFEGGSLVRCKELLRDGKKVFLAVEEINN